MSLPVVFTGPIACGSFAAGDRVWAVTLLDATRGAGEWLLRLRLAGRDASHELTVRASGDANHGLTARRIIDALAAWLSKPHGERPAFLHIP